jgi:hypothetical protein
MSSSDEEAFRRYDEAQALADKLRRESEELRRDISKEMEKLRAFLRPYHPNDPPDDPPDDPPVVDGGAGTGEPSSSTGPGD